MEKILFDAVTKTDLNIFVGIFILLALKSVIELGKFTYNIFKTKADVSEKTVRQLSLSLDMNTKSLDKMSEKMIQFETKLAKMAKMELDLRRTFFALKEVAGDKWPDIKKKILDDQF